MAASGREPIEGESRQSDAGYFFLTGKFVLGSICERCPFIVTWLSCEGDSLFYIIYGRGCGFGGDRTGGWAIDAWRTWKRTTGDSKIFLPLRS